MSKGFEAGKIYELSQEWKDYFDSFGEDCLGYHYVTIESPDLDGDIQKCYVINKDKITHPAFSNRAIPIKFSDVKICSLSSTSRLKLFKISCLRADDICLEDIYFIEAVVVAQNEEEASSMHPNGIDKIPNHFRPYTWTNNTADIEVEYLGDYFGELDSLRVICAREVRR